MWFRDSTWKVSFYSGCITYEVEVLEGFLGSVYRAVTWRCW